MMKPDNAPLEIIHAGGKLTLNSKSLPSAVAYHCTVPCSCYYYWSNCIHWFAIQRPKPSN